MAAWLIFAAHREDDPALWNSHWIAQQTERLEPSPATVLRGPLAVREKLEATLADPELEGVALFGHGRPHAVMGSDKREALDRGNVHLLANRWAHAIACNTGRELVPAAAAHGAFAVGYSVSLIVEWTLEELPRELRDRIAEMVTATTRGLIEGLRTKEALAMRAEIAAEAVSQWLLENTEDGYLGVHGLASQLVERMVVSG